MTFSLCNDRFLLSLIVLSCCAMIPGNALAIDCDEKSANFTRMGDDYFQFDGVPKLTDKEKNTVRKFVKDLHRELRFSTQEIICRGNGENVRKTTREGQGQAVLTESSLYPLIINMEVEYENTIKLNSLELLALDSTFSFNISKNKISAESFYRNNGIFFERVYEVSRSRGKMKLTIDEYGSGLFYSRREFEFFR